MKKNLLLFLLCVASFGANAQCTQMPSYERKKPWSTSADIVTVCASDDDVTISLAVSGPFNFNSQTYLEYTNPSNGKIEKVNLKDSWRETGEYAMRFASMGYAYLSLVFPPLPNGVNKIDLISDKLRLYGISIFPVERGIQQNEIKRIAVSEEEIEVLVKETNANIAGIYEGTGVGALRLAVVEEDDSFFIVYISEDIEGDETWKCGEVRATLRPTAVSNVYKADWFNFQKQKRAAVISFDEYSMSVDLGDENPVVFIKMGEANRNVSIGDVSNENWTGTGYAIGDNYIVTNFHVASDAKTITIKGVKGDMNTGYTAELVATDKVNDIAILKITDSQFAGFGTIPYAVQQRIADVGEDVFVLGYPLTQALGNEIKLTNGIISSRTGYQGNIATYQMSAPVQPGNSGAPMFDNKGNVIGIVVAGVPGAENVGYAIKTSYLNILIESAGVNIKLPANNAISTLSLSEKVKRLKNFVFYIECSK